MQEARSKGTHTDIEWAALFSACGSACLKCGATEKVERDHITPIYQGGSDSIENIQPLCRSCNGAKGPDNTDLRPENWRGRLSSAIEVLSPKSQRNQPSKATDVGSTLNERSTNQKPDTRYQNISSSLRSEDNALVPVQEPAQNEFEEFWNLYPHKVGKRDAMQAFSRARKRTDFETMASGLKRYAGKTDDRPWCNPATWLNQDRWGDSPAPPPRGQPPDRAPDLSDMFRNLANSQQQDYRDDRRTIEGSDNLRNLDGSFEALPRIASTQGQPR
jgi:hypothetical protein